MGTYRDYYLLTKPGIIKGNVLVAAAAYLFGAKNHIDVSTLFGLLLGTSSIIAAGCVVNNYFDRHIDKHMQRTSKRALVTGAIKPVQAFIFAGSLGLIGTLSLLLLVNTLTFLGGSVGFVTYAFIYTFAKHKTVHATLVGTLPGATPPVAGYVAATGRIDTAAIILFFTMVAWQMAHFYAISLFRMKEYAAAEVPVMSVAKGQKATRKYIIGYIVLFAAIAPLLSILGYAGFTYGVVVTLAAMYWLLAALQPVFTYERWAKKVFGVSLVLLLVFSVLLASNSFLP